MSRLLLVAALVLGCTPQRTPPNVLLITIDTLRADRVGAYGHPNAHTPVLDRLAAEGVRFDQASAQAPMTLPSHASILTGRSPVSHGVRTNGSFRLDDGEQTLAEILHDAGYRTGAVIGAVVLNGRYGLRQGFENYEDLVVRTSRGASELERDAGRVTDRAVEWLRARDDRPFFLWAHYFDPHQPYVPPAHAREGAEDAYQGEVAYVDQELGRLLATLRELGVDERTLVVVTSDHGEGLGEHAEPTHSYFVYETTLRVPLLVRLPGGLPAARVVDAPVRSLDIVPTILELVELPAKPDADGVSLVSWMRSEAPPPELEVYGESLAAALSFGYSPLRSLRVGSWKLILAPRPELYDLSQDPHERRNLAPAAPDRVARLRGRLGAIVSGRAATAREGSSALALDPTTRAQLQQLGYVGPGASHGLARDLDRDLAPRGLDPKDVSDVFDLLAEGEGLHKEGRFAAAERAFRAALRRDPANEYATTYLAILYGEQKQLDRALRVFEGLKRPPAMGLTLEIQGKLLVRKGEWARAREVFEALLEKEPHNVWGHYYLGRAYQALGRHADATRAFERAVRVEPSLAEAHAALAGARLRQGDAEEAEAEFRAAIQLAPGRADYHDGLGQSLQRLGRLDEALAAYREALARDASHLAAREHAALCLLGRGEIDAAQHEIQPVLAARPGSVAALVVSAARALAEGDLEFAELLLERAVVRDPRLAEAWYQLARVRQRRGAAQSAREALERAVGAGGPAFRARASAEKQAR